MAVAQGFGKTITSGSVFAYDVADTRNSFRGEPTTNLATNTPLFGGWPGSYTLIESTTKTFDFRTSSIEWGGDAAWTTFYYNVSEYTGQYVTISAIVESFDESNGIFSFMWIGQTVDAQVYLGYSPEQDRNTKTTKTREGISWSGVIGTGGKVGITLWMNNGGPSGSITVRFSNLQVEAKPHSTPFANGTRSTTQGLLDLTGNNTIDLSNVSFDSNAQMTFDGTDDVITVPMQNLKPTSSITQEVVVYINSNTTQVFIGAQYGTSSGNSYALWLNGANNLAGGVNIGGSFNNQSQTYTITTSRWYHFIHTYDGTDQKLYVNGVMVRSWPTTGTITYNDNNTLLAIGNDWNGSGYNIGASLATHGKQDITKIYNRALTAAEVNQNYRHYKTRFNLS